MKPPDAFREMRVVSTKHRAKAREREEALQRQVGAGRPRAPLLAGESGREGKSWREEKSLQILATGKGTDM